MRSLLDSFIEFVSYDAERDFYVKIFPDLLKNSGDTFIKIRPMKRTDIKQMLEIEKQVYDFPWSEGTLHDCMTAGYHCWVCEQVGTVLAYGILSVGAGESHIMNLCVAPAVQNQGYGRKMMQHLINEARRQQAEVLLLEVRPSNPIAIGLYDSMGFNEIGRRKDYYPALEGREDAVMMAIELNLEHIFSEVDESVSTP
jgi:ribosomal-protein-alanine N-acetyltransferase